MFKHEIPPLFLFVLRLYLPQSVIIVNESIKAIFLQQPAMILLP